MRRIFAVSAAGAAVRGLAVPAVAATPTLEFNKWVVPAENGDHKVAGGTTYKHCGSNTVLGIDAHGTVSGATKGDDYKAVWRKDGQKIVTFTEHWHKANGKVKVATLSNSADDMPDGKYKVTVKENGKVLGSSSIRLKTKSC